MQRAFLPLAFLLVVAALAACETISPFSETAYRLSTGIKATSLVLMDKAAEPYSLHEDAAEALLLEARKAYEYALHRPKNEDSTAQWAIMIDPERALLAGFLRKWKEDGQLRPFLVAEAKRSVAAGFDQISELESGKSKEKKP